MNKITSFNPIQWAKVSKAEQIRTVANLIVEMNIDITEGYNNWRNIAFGISLELGEEGRSIFHDISRFNAGYKYEECDKLYSNCIKRLHDTTDHSGITIASFFKYAKEAGIDIKVAPSHDDVARNGNFASLANPAKGANMTNMTNMTNMAMAPNASTAINGTTAEAEVEHEVAEAIPLPTFCDKVTGSLPLIFRDISSLGKTLTEKDMLLLASITILSGAFPEAYAIYDSSKVYANLFTFLVANAASGKGRTTSCLKLVSLIEQEVREANKQEMDDYQQELADIRAMGRKASGMPLPKEPPYRSLIIPANCSSTAIYQALHDNHDQGITFETEADSLANTLKSDYGNFSDGLRKGFHHEDITYRRRKENEHVEIHNPKWTVYLTGTPGQVTNLIPSAENGLFSRFLFMKVDIPAKWHNVFSKSNRTIDEEMEAIGKRVYDIHLILKKKQGGIEFKLTEEQEDKFNDFFNKLVEEYKDMLGRDFVANIYRMGLSAYRIAMILSITRLEGTTSLPECIICKDEDLECALIIADTLMQHAARIFSTLLPSKEGDDVMGIKLSPKSEKLFAALPASFNRQMVLAAAQKLGIAKRTAEKYVGEYVSRYNLCKRVDNGKYEKVDLTENQQDSTPR